MAVVGIILFVIIGLFCGADLVAGSTGFLRWFFALGSEIITLFFVSCLSENVDSDATSTKVMNVIGTVFWGIGLLLLFSDVEGVAGRAFFCFACLFIAPYVIVATLNTLFYDSVYAMILIGIAKVASSVLLYTTDLEYVSVEFPGKLAAYISIISLFVLLFWKITIPKIIAASNEERHERKIREKIYCSKQLIFAAGENDRNTVLDMLKKDADINYEDSYGYTPLSKAIINGNVDIALLLLENGADTNYKTEDGFTPLDRAFMRGNKEIISFLLEKGADISENDSSFKAALDFAIKNENAELLSLLAEKAAHTDFYCEGKPLLFFAIENNYKNFVTLLIEKGVHKNARFDSDDDFKEITPLFFAVWQENKDIVLLLLKNKVDINMGARAKLQQISLLDYIPLSPLDCAVMGHNKELVSILIENGANSNYCKGGLTPLEIAIMANDKDMASFLIEKGADVNFAGTVGETPLFTAVREKNKKFISLLIENGADINYVAKDDMTPLSVAIYINDEKTVSLLIENGADVNFATKEDFAVLQKAICDRNKKILSLLLNAGAEVNRNSHKIETALLDAIDTKSYDSEIVSLLIERGADVNLESVYNGQTPLTFAVSQNNKEAVSLLLKSGADPNKKSSKFGAPLMIAFQMVNKEMCSLLIESGANSDEVFLVAAAMPKTDAAQFFLDRGANVNCESSNGCTPLTSAICFRCKEMVLFLISNGADVNFEMSGPSDKKMARTPLETAIVTGNAEMVSLLITYGADVNYKTKNGNTPLLFVAMHGKADIVPILKDAGANSGGKNDAR